MIVFVIKCKELLDFDNFYILHIGGSKFKNFGDLIDSNVFFFFFLVLYIQYNIGYKIYSENKFSLSISKISWEYFKNQNCLKIFNIFMDTLLKSQF